MNKYILILTLSFVLISPVIAQEIEEGVVKKFYKNGSLQMTGFNTNSKANGIFVQYREDGSVETIRELKDNELHGTFLGFHKNGVLDYKGEFVNGEAVGTHKIYDEKGQLIRLDIHENNKSLQILFEDGQPILRGD